MSEPVPVASRVHAVTVYRQGALVTRAGELPEGITRVRFGPLPMAMDDGSVRVALRNGGRALACDVRIVLAVPPPDDSLAPARPEELEVAALQIARLDDRLDQLRRLAARIEGIGVVSRPAPRPGREPSESPARARLALLELRERRLAAIDEERARVAHDKERAKRQLADLEERNRRASTARRPEAHELRKAAVVTLSAPAPGATLELTYGVDAARWAPTYTMRLDAEVSRGTLEVRAVVCQLTGEDWDGAALTLSTAELRGWAELPELAAIRIGRAQPPPARIGWRPAPAGTEELFEDYDRSRILPPPEIPPIDAPLAPLQATPPAESIPAVAALAGAPMPPPQAARAPVGGPPLALPAPAPERAAAAPNFARARKAEVLEEERELALLDEPAAPPPEPPPTAAQAMLDYGMLHMPSPDASVRGKLVLRSRRELYATLVREASLEVDLERALAGVEDSWRIVRDASLPAGCVRLRPSGFDYVYRAEGRVALPSDGAFHSLSLLSRPVKASLRFVVVARESRDAFRFVELDNPLDAPLLAGPIDVYADDAFLLTGRLEDVPPKGVLRLGLGVDQRVKISRNARFKEKSVGLMGGKLDLQHEVEVEIESHVPREAELELRERIPVTREGEEAIEVIEGAIDPVWERWEPEDDDLLKGGRRWRVRIAPGAKQRVVARYTIRISSKNELLGGNRREA
jgi:hypothetical protein